MIPAPSNRTPERTSKRKHGMSMDAIQTLGGTAGESVRETVGAPAARPCRIRERRSAT